MTVFSLDLLSFYVTLEEVKEFRVDTFKLEAKYGMIETAFQNALEPVSV